MQTDTLNPESYIEQGGLGRHETFTPRYGWLKKGYEAVKKDGNIFKAKDAIERLGVGKNMVNSIRFWCQAFNLIEFDDNKQMVPTEFGKRLLDDDGWDPYLEDMASLWLLHWQLFIPKIEAINWPLAFNKCNLWSFNIQSLSKVLIDSAQKFSRHHSASPKSFEKDASCIIRMYAKDISEKELEVDCPFTQLGIIIKGEEDNLFSFNTSEKQDLPPLIFAATCFSFIDNYAPYGQKTIGLQRLTYDFNSPGVIFKLPESVVGSYLEKARKLVESFSLVDYLGNIQLHLNGDPLDIYWQTLETYYKGEAK